MRGLCRFSSGVKKISSVFSLGDCPVKHGKIGKNRENCVLFKTHMFLKNVIHHIDNNNEWLLLSASFTAKFGLVFALTLENAFLEVSF